MVASLTAWERFRPVLSDFLGAVGAQAVVQVLGFVSSILIIRWLSPAEYALYTIALSLQGALSATADSGIAANVMAQSGRVWRDPQALGGVLAAGERLRNTLASVLILFISPLGFYILYRNYDDQWGAALVMLAVVVSFVAYLPVALLEIPLKLHADFSRLQQIRIVTALARSLILVGSALVQPLAWLLVLVTGLVQLTATPVLRRFSACYANLDQAPLATSLSELRQVVRRSLPGAVHYSVQSQVTIWLLATLGVAQSVADMGALGRLAAVGVLVTVAFDTAVVPRIAKLPLSEVALTVKKILAMAAGILFACAYGLICATGSVISILGENYGHLEVEFSMLCITTAVGLLSAFVWSINNARAFVPPWYVYPFSGTICFVLFLSVFGVSTPISALKTQLAVTVCTLLVNILVFRIKLSRAVEGGN